MSAQALLQSLKESILSQASVKAIYGEPILTHGKTIVPLAKIMYGYGTVVTIIATRATARAIR